MLICSCYDRNEVLIAVCITMVSMCLTMTTFSRSLLWKVAAFLPWKIVGSDLHHL